MVETQKKALEIAGGSGDPEGRANALFALARTLLYQGSLKEVVANRQRINETIDQARALVGLGGVPDDVWDMLSMLDDLVAGKVDRIAGFVEKTVPAHLAALQSAYAAQAERAGLAAVRMKALLQQAVEINGGPIRGLFWQARVQLSSPACVVTDAAVVPSQFKFRRFKMSFDYPVSAKLEKEVQALIAKYGSDKAKVAGFSNLKAGVTEEIPAAPLIQVWKSKRDEKTGLAPQTPGTVVSQDAHVRIEASKAKAGDFNPTPIRLVTEGEK